MSRVQFFKTSLVGLLLFSIAAQSSYLTYSFDLGGQSEAANSEPLAKESEFEKESSGSDPNEAYGVFCSTSTPRNDRTLLLQEVEELRNSLFFGPVLHLRGPPLSV